MKKASNKRIRENNKLTIKEWVVVSVAALMFGILVFMFTYKESLAYPEQLTQDLIYKSDQALNNDIKIIAIDDKSIQEIGDYSLWSRQLYAQLINALCADGNKPAVIGFDITFFTERDAAGDEAFAEACDMAGNVVLACQLNMQEGNFVSSEGSAEHTYWDGEVLVPIFDKMADIDTGFVNIILDNDGFVRHALLKVEAEGDMWESLAMSISRKYCEEMGKEFIEPKTDNTGSVMINYVASPGSYEHISFVDVISGRVPASVFDDCIVIVGAYSEGMMDAYNVMVDKRSRMYGVEINANIVQNILSGEQLKRPKLLLVAIVNGVAATILLLVTNRKKIRTLTIVVGGAMAAHITLCLILHGAGTLWYITYMLLALLLVYIINVIWLYIYERKDKERELRMLLFSMAEAMTEAIDKRTPYNASHTRKVAEYSVELANYINEQYRKRKTKLHMPKDEINQLKLAALLHDVGKLSIPIEVLDKPTRLGYHKRDLFNRFEKIELLYKLDMANSTKEEVAVMEELDILAEIKQFVSILDKKEFLSDEDKNKIDQFVDKKYTYTDGETIPYFTEEEIECLKIQKGTLTKAEMEQVHNHAVFTYEILEMVRFGKNYSEVRAIAASHHEFLNGKGYPKNLKADEIDVATRILTICDVYDALTADDRPYKKAKTKEQSFKILDFMAKDGEIDSELLEFAKELWNKV